VDAFQKALLFKLTQRLAQRSHRDRQRGRHLPFRRQTLTITQTTRPDIADQHFADLQIDGQRSGGIGTGQKRLKNKIDTALIYINRNAMQGKNEVRSNRTLLRTGNATSMTIVPVTSADLDAAEVSWFSALCSDDYEFLGVPDGKLRSSWEHCSDILKEAEAQGFRNILCPSSYQVGQDTLSLWPAARRSPKTSTSWRPFAAARCSRSCWRAPSRRSTTCCVAG
jgi:hypothetical protein